MTASTIRYRLIRSRRKTTSITVTIDGEVIVRAPLHRAVSEIDAFVREKRNWILNKQALQKSRAAQREALPEPTQEQIEALKREAERIIPPRAAYYAARMGITYGKITIRHQKTRWGSCSSKGNLNFNCFLVLAPDRVIDYVIVHELCHRREMNHSAAFWKQVAGILPDYKEREAWLKKNGNLLMRGVDLRMM